MIYRFTDIDWDAPSEAGLPNSVDIYVDYLVEEDNVTDLLTESFDFCVNGAVVEKLEEL
jgi:hypothetical protein